MAVGVVEGVGHLGGDAHRFLDAQLGFPVELPAQRLAVEERHDVIQEAPLAPGVEEREDVRVLELRGGRDLPEEAFRPQQCREFGAEHLDRDPAVMPEVRGEEDRRHATGADRAVDLVAIAKGGLQLGERVGHEGGSGTSPTYRSSAGRRQPHGPPPGSGASAWGGIPAPPSHRSGRSNAQAVGHGDAMPCRRGGLARAHSLPPPRAHGAPRRSSAHPHPRRATLARVLGRWPPGAGAVRWRSAQAHRSGGTHHRRSDRTRSPSIPATSMPGAWRSTVVRPSRRTRSATATT